jgi:hypothetical protein
VIARNEHDQAPDAGRGDSERIPFPLHDQCRNGHRLELGQAARSRRPARAAGRSQREGKAQHSGGPGRTGSAACHARARRPATDDEGQALQPPRAQVSDDRRPGRIELVRTKPEEARQYLKGYTAIEGPLTSEVPLASYMLYSEFKKSDIAYFQKFFDLFFDKGIFSSQLMVEPMLYRS